MPSRAYTSFLRDDNCSAWCRLSRCQCPLGLIPHFYGFDRRLPGYQKVSQCQCPLGLIPHFYQIHVIWYQPEQQGCQCPLGLIPHFYYKKQSFPVREKWSVSMPSRAYTSFLQYPFKNLGFMRFPEPVFAGIYQNILTTAVFRAC